MPSHKQCQQILRLRRGCASGLETYMPSNAVYLCHTKTQLTVNMSFHEHRLSQPGGHQGSGQRSMSKRAFVLSPSIPFIALPITHTTTQVSHLRVQRRTKKPSRAIWCLHQYHVVLTQYAPPILGENLVQ